MEVGMRRAHTDRTRMQGWMRDQLNKVLREELSSLSRENFLLLPSPSYTSTAAFTNCSQGHRHHAFLSVSPTSTLHGLQDEDYVSLFPFTPDLNIKGLISMFRVRIQ